MKLVEKLALNIKEQRKIKKLSQDKIAKICGISQQQFQFVESGNHNVTINTVEVIAKGLDVEPFELFI